MKLRPSEKIVLGLVVLALVLASLSYPRLPEQFASHWNAAGEVEACTSGFVGVLLLPMVLAGSVLLFLAIPRIDPLQANLANFRKGFNGFVLLFSLFLLLASAQMLLWNHGVRVRPSYFFPVALGVLFCHCGILCEHTGRNWLVGFRTPWTMSGDRVWRQTHRLGARLFKIAGVISCLGVFSRRFARVIALAPVLAVLLWTTGYSYFAHQKEFKGVVS